MASVYEHLGVKTIVNAAGPVTRLSGALMSEEVGAAMQEASPQVLPPSVERSR